MMMVLYLRVVCELQAVEMIFSRKNLCRIGTRVNSSLSTLKRELNLES
jgi:hypothetical protein